MEMLISASDFLRHKRKCSEPNASDFQTWPINLTQLIFLCHFDHHTLWEGHNTTDWRSNWCLWFIAQLPFITSQPGEPTSLKVVPAAEQASHKKSWGNCLQVKLLPGPWPHPPPPPSFCLFDKGCPAVTCPFVTVLNCQPTLVLHPITIWPHHCLLQTSITLC